MPTYGQGASQPESGFVPHIVSWTKNVRPYLFKRSAKFYRESHCLCRAMEAFEKKRDP